MAKMLNYAKITVETPRERWTFDTHEVYLSSTDNGVTTHISVAPMKNKRMTTLPEKEKAPVEDTKKLTDPVSDAFKRGALKLVAGKARLIERQRLEGARLIQQAQEQAAAERNVAAHEFNMTVLGAPHEGLSYDEIDAYLDEQHLDSIEVATDHVYMQDTKILYPTEAGA